MASDDAKNAFPIRTERSQAVCTSEIVSAGGVTAYMVEFASVTVRRHGTDHVTLSTGQFVQTPNSKIYRIEKIVCDPFAKMTMMRLREYVRTDDGAFEATPRRVIAPKNAFKALVPLAGDALSPRVIRETQQADAAALDPGVLFRYEPGYVAGTKLNILKK